METARAIAPPDAIGQLNGICDGYLTFAAHRTALFQLMFNSPNLDRSDPDLLAQSARAYQILRAACQPFGRSDPDEALETAVWSLVHGFALLGFSDPATSGGPKATPKFGILLAILLNGHQAPRA